VNATSARAIANRAAVSSSSFYTHFEDVDDVLAASFAAAAEALVEVLAAACAEEPEPGAVVAAALSFAAAEPALAALLGLELAVAVSAVADRREQLTRQLGELLGSRSEVGREGFSEIRAQLAAAALSLVGERLDRSTPAELGTLSVELALLLG
jgi:AcrR family transcriptional regulator